MLAAATSQNRSWSLIERLAFPAPQASYSIHSFPGELILIPSLDDRWVQESNKPADKNFNSQIPCLFLTSPFARFILICFHGNAEDLGKIYPFLKSLRDIFKVHVLAVEYPGYGICLGSPSEQGIMANARAAMRFVREALSWPLDGIKLFGRSLGTGPAVALASEVPVAGLILVAPFLSMRKVLEGQMGAVAQLAEERFRNYELAERIESSTLIVHGKQDSLVPVEHGMELYKLLPGRKMMVCPEKMHHNSPLLENISIFVRPMTQFFSLPDYTFTDLELPHWVLPTHSARSRISRLPDHDIQNTTGFGDLEAAQVMNATGPPAGLIRARLEVPANTRESGKDSETGMSMKAVSALQRAAWTGKNDDVPKVRKPDLQRPMQPSEAIGRSTSLDSYEFADDAVEEVLTESLATFRPSLPWRLRI